MLRLRCPKKGKTSRIARRAPFLWPNEHINIIKGSGSFWATSSYSRFVINVTTVSTWLARGDCECVMSRLSWQRRLVPDNFAELLLRDWQDMLQDVSSVQHPRSRCVSFGDGHLFKVRLKTDKWHLVSKLVCCTEPNRSRTLAWTDVMPLLRGTAVERRSLTCELSLSCARPAADGWPLMRVNRPLWVSQPGRLSLSSFWGR